MKSAMITRLLVLHPTLGCLAWSSRLLAPFTGTTPSSSRRALVSASSPRWTTSSSSSSSTPEIDPATRIWRQSGLLGGDFAGYNTQCSTVTGDPQPLPVYLVPASMVEWGQHPKTLEVIVSEDNNNDDDDTSWNRICLSVLPETGCGVDNLEVKKSTETDWRILQANDDKCIGLIRLDPTPTTTGSIETIFSLPEENHRLRVTVTLSKINEETSSSPIALHSIGLSYERRFDESTQGTRADGGGLDGASVSRWMGPMMTKNGANTLETKTSEPSPKEGEKYFLQLPANVTLEYRSLRDEVSQLLLSHTCSRGHEMTYEWKTDQLDTIRIVS